MKKNLLIFVVIIAIAGIWLVTAFVLKPTAPAAAPTGFTTYQNSQEQLSISYPDRMLPATAQQPYFLLDNSIAVFMSQDQDYRPMNYLQDSWLTISKANIDETACHAASDNGLVYNQQTKINGVSFWTAQGTDAGAGNRYETTSYRTFHNGVCYEVMATLHYASDWTDVDEAAMAASQTKARDLLNQAVKTFQFDR